MASNVVSDNFETGTGGVPQLGGTGATTCKAWVNFNGTSTVAIRDSYNVSSITDTGVGRYTANFASSMSNTNYSPTQSGEISHDGVNANPSGFFVPSRDILPTVSGYSVESRGTDGNNYDGSFFNIFVFGD